MPISQRDESLPRGAEVDDYYCLEHILLPADATRIALKIASWSYNASTLKITYSGRATSTLSDGRLGARLPQRVATGRGVARCHI